MEQVDKITNALNTLQDAGFFVQNLWHINDVRDRFKCTDEQAMQVLSSALTSDYVIEKAHYAIEDEAFELELEEKEDY